MISKSLIAASTKPMLLSILLNGKSYGYQIIQRVRSLSGGKFKWSDGMLYPVLHRLERDGLITSQWRISDGKRPRKYYTLTEKGREAWAAEQKQWMSVNDVLAKLWESLPSPASA
ncbi:MAG TPA: PadR family transcriptional regulator [Candidatus Latescibacteria bacterium]|nr:PadR family transcriptional regulator [Candidatus Latescibacterota bacterium]